MMGNVLFPSKVEFQQTSAVAPRCNRCDCRSVPTLHSSSSRYRYVKVVQRRRLAAMDDSVWYFVSTLQVLLGWLLPFVACAEAADGVEWLASWLALALALPLAGPGVSPRDLIRETPWRKLWSNGTERISLPRDRVREEEAKMPSDGRTDWGKSRWCIQGGPWIPFHSTASNWCLHSLLASAVLSERDIRRTRYGTINVPNEPGQQVQALQAH